MLSIGINPVTAGVLTPKSRGIVLSNYNVNDTLAIGGTVGSLTPPSGYTVEIIYDCGGRFAVSGGNLVTARYLTAGQYKPILRAYKAGSRPLGVGSQNGRKLPIGGDYVLEPVINVAAVFSPADISGLVAAWDFSQGVVVGAANTITTVAGAFGTSKTLTGFVTGGRQPLILSGEGPGGKSAASFRSATGQYFTVSPTIDVDDFTGFAVIRPITTGADMAFFGTEVDGRHWRINPGTTMEANFGTLANATLSTAYAAGAMLGRYSAVALRHDGASGASSSFLDGRTSATGVAQGTTAASFDRVGRRSSTNTSHANYDATIYLAYNRVLTDDEMAKVWAFLENYRTRDWYVASAAVGQGTGFNANHARADTPSTTGLYRQDDRILYKGGDYFYNIVHSGSGQYLTPDNRPITFGAYGSGKPHIWGAQASALAYTLSSDYKYTASLARTNEMDVIWWYRDGLSADPILVRNVYGGAITDDTFEWAAGTLTIQLETGKNPNNEIIIIPADSTTQCFWPVSKTLMEFDGLEIRHYATAGWNPATTGNLIQRSAVEFNQSDGCSITTAGVIVQLNNIRYNGHHRSTSSGNGDGMSAHGGSAAIARYNYFKGNHVSGVRNYGGVSSTIEGNVIEDNNQNIFMLYNAGVNSAAAWVARANVILRSAADQNRNGLAMEALTAANMTATDNLFIGSGVVDGKAMSNSGGGSLTQSGNAQTGFASLT